MELKTNKFTRQINAEFQQGQNKQLVFSICSEQPYLRFDENYGNYYEVLEVSTEAIDDTRLQNGISFLKDHQQKSQLGIVKRWWINNKKLYVSVKFSRSNFAKGIKADIEEGIRPWTSLGYIVQKFEKTGQIDGIPVLTAKRYSIYECSSVSTPADPSVGFNRSLQIEQKGQVDMNAQADKTDTASELDQQELETKESNEQLENKDLVGEDLETKAEEVAETKEEKEEIKEEVCPECGKNPCECEKNMETTEQGKEEVKECGGQPEKKDLEVKNLSIDNILSDEAKQQIQIRALGRIYECEKKAEEFILQNKSLDDFKNYLKNGSEQSENSIQDTKKMDRKYFSISNAIRNYCKQYKGDISQDYETQVIDENKRNFGVNDADIVLSERELHVRALGPTSGKGAELIKTDYLPQEFVTYLRPQLTLEKTGYYSIPVNGNAVEFAVCTSGSTAAMYGLDGELSAGDLSFANKTLTPHKAGVCIPIPYSLILQGRPEVDAMVEADVVNALYQLRDEQILVGTGTNNEVLGIVNTSGINVITGASISGGQAWGAMLSGVNEIRKKNIFSENISYVMNGDTYTTLKQTMKNKDNCFAGFIIDDNDKIGNYPVFVNNALTGNTVIVGDFGEVAVADFEGLKIKVDDITYVKKNAIQIVAIKAFDAVVRRTGAFTKITLSA